MRPPIASEHPPTTDPVGAAPRPRRARWVPAVVVVALLLSLTGSLNIWLNRSSAQATVASSTLLRLDSMLNEEGTLQWRALAERGIPTRVAAEVGTLRAGEGALIDALGTVLPPEELAELRQLIDDHHVSLDQELSLLALGRTDDAVAFETEVTAPGFRELSTWLERRSVAAAEAAARRASLAHSVLIVTLALVASVIGLLAWRADRAHRCTLAISARLLEQERTRVDDLRRSEASIRHQSEHDPLTGLPNRLRFGRALQETAAHRALAVLFIDLDGFKAVNDSLGHAAGDELLVAVGERLRRCARTSDTIARLGGDEFAILLDGADDELATGVATRVVERLSEPLQLATGRVEVGASVGIAVGAAGSDPDALLTEADHRMYAMKHSQAQARRVAAPAGR